MNLEGIQQTLKEMRLDGWLFCDFHNRDPIAYHILGLDPNKMTTRRWFYLIPAEGEPRKLVHSVEPAKLDPLPGVKKVYLPWTQLHSLLGEMLAGMKKIAMQYSPLNTIPYISMVDGGTIELVRRSGVEIESSKDLVQIFEAYVSPKAYELHLEAGKIMHEICNQAFVEIGRRLRTAAKFTEYDIQQFMVDLYGKNDLVWDDGPPIVAVNEHASDPHYEPAAGKGAAIQKGDVVLIDLWAKKRAPEAIYFDITWMGYVGSNIPSKVREVFEVLKEGRDSAVSFLEKRLGAGKDVYGWEVDDVCRGVIKERGYGDYFLHRTGHSIGLQVHGNGVNIDNLETKDERQILPGTCFSIEPGIYLPEFGERTEIDVYISGERKVKVTGPRQNELIRIL